MPIATLFYSFEDVQRAKRFIELDGRGSGALTEQEQREFQILLRIMASRSFSAIGSAEHSTVSDTASTAFIGVLFGLLIGCVATLIAIA